MTKCAKPKTCSLEFTIPYNPVTKKNSQTRSWTGKTLPSKAYQKYEPKAVASIPQPIRSLRIHRRINVKALYYMKTDYYAPGRKAVIDLSNLHNALHDTLVTAHVVEDDNCRIIYSTDGSRVLHDKKHPRTEVEITEV